MNATMKLYSSILVTVLGLGATLAACGDDTTGTGGTGGTGGADPTTSAKSTAASTGASSGASSGSGMTGPGLKLINKTAFNPANPAGPELPEGLAVTADSKTAYVGFAITGKIQKVSLPDGAVTDFGTVPAPPAPMTGLVLGVAIDSVGDVYVGVASFVAAAQYQGGIYKIAKAGGAGVLYAKDAAMTFPNGLSFDKDDNLFVADSKDGSIFKIAKGGATVAKWASDPLLKGNGGAANPCASGLGFDIGANGIIFTATEAYVANTDKASIIKIPITGGVAGTAVEFSKSDATTCLPLKGADGLAFDKNGDILVAANGQNALYRVKKDGGTPTKLVEKDLLDSPASLVYLSVTNEVLVTNSAVANALSGMPAKPSLVSYGPLP